MFFVSKYFVYLQHHSTEIFPHILNKFKMKNESKNDRHVSYWAAYELNGIEAFNEVNASNKKEAIKIAKAIATFTNGKLLRVGEKIEITKYNFIYEANGNK